MPTGTNRPEQVLSLSQRLWSIAGMVGALNHRLPLDFEISC